MDGWQQILNLKLGVNSARPKTMTIPAIFSKEEL